MKKNLLLICFLISIQQVKPQEIPQIKTQKGFFQLDFLSIKMPKNQNIFEPNMGFAGLHYNLKFNNFYTGLGIYGSVSGRRGGFFTLGINAGYTHYFTNSFFIDTGLHFGGGGGASAPDGGGAFMLPHANLGYHFNNFSILTGWSYSNFFDRGTIKSHQFNIAVRVPINFNYSFFSNRQKSYKIKDIQATQWNKPSNKIALQIQLTNLKAKHLPFINNTNANKRTIQLAGFELNSYLTNTLFFFIKADGAYSGIPAGYMDVVIGGGYQLQINKNRTHLLGKLGIGASGGGGVDTKGGFLISPEVSIEQKLLNNIFLVATSGYTLQPSGSFKAINYGLGLKHYINNGTFSKEKKYTTSIFKGIEAIVKEDIYFNAKRTTGLKQNMYQISLQINFFLTKHVYGAGQTSFANFGNAGAYAEGIVGLGFQHHLFTNHKIAAFTQILTGAAGGGGIKTGEGLIIKPSAGLQYKLFNQLTIRTAIGYVQANNTQFLSNAFANFGISYQFSFLSSK